MSTSPTSNRTVLLWGHQWWLAGRAEPLEFQTLAHAAEVLAAHAERPTRLRLIYQPESLVSVAAACPRGNRGALQDALGLEHPAITDPAHAWSHEPILGAAEGYGTFLHYERTPGLFKLIEQLARHGITVTTAWPLATFLHALPTEWSDSGAVCVLAVSGEQAIAYHHPANGVRAILQWQGDSALAEAMAWLSREQAKSPGDPALLVTTAEPAEDFTDVPCLALTDALALPVILPRAHPAQLLPAVPFLTSQRAAIAASILLLLTAGWTGTAYAREFHAWTNQTRAAVQEKNALRAEIEHYRVNSAEIVALRAQLAGPGLSPPVGELLDTVCATLPPQIALDRVRVAQGRFRLSGHVAANAEWERWCNALGSKRWKLNPSAPRETGAFTVQGTFTP
jgi:hypothetical protein